MRLSTVSVRIRQEIASLQISCWSFDNQLYCRITPCIDMISSSTMLRIETLKSWISMLQCIIRQFASFDNDSLSMNRSSQVESLIQQISHNISSSYDAFFNHLAIKQFKLFYLTTQKYIERKGNKSVVQYNKLNLKEPC